ncbi:MAG: hypothetical protein MI747_16360 [Desulfobacterales bacterium]|nr:hypothetical protein [Desulfobacterales bacterium]
MKTRVKTSLIPSWSYGGLLGLISLTGFAQMPIFKRYYIADIPGLGWLAQFQATHLLHYGLAALFLGLCAHWVVDFFLNKREHNRPVNRFGRINALAMGLLCITGLLMVWKNFQGVHFPHGLIIALDLIHMGSCMVLLLFTTLSFFIRPKG